MPSRRQCRELERMSNRGNKNRTGLARTYFKTGCSDPVTALSYWRRRFNSVDNYLQHYWFPRKWGKRVPQGYSTVKNGKPVGYRVFDKNNGFWKYD